METSTTVCDLVCVRLLVWGTLTSMFITQSCACSGCAKTNSIEEPGCRVISTVILEWELDLGVGDEDIVVGFTGVGLSWQLNSNLLYTVCCRNVLIIAETCR